jgi:hypothetical protein
MDHLAQKIVKQSRNVSGPAFMQMGEFMNTGRMPVGMTGEIGAQEQELAAAKRDIQETGVRGGQMKTALAQLPLERLGMRDQMRSKMFELAVNSSLGASGQGFSAQGAAASNLNTLGAQRIQQNQSLVGMGGQGAGMLAGAAAAMF